VRAASQEALAVLRSAGLRTPDRFLDSFYGETATASHIRALLEELPEGVSEPMCHPGRADRELLEGSSYAKEREREVGVLADPELRRFLEKREIELISFGEL
jgi:chitin disaccharide deacetylase